MVAVEVAGDTLQKALQINLDPRWYGTIAEIGAGQEVARWFFRAGGAAGTVAKTISAYDMAVSDAVYGRSGRYVSSQRLQAMLDHEFRAEHGAAGRLPRRRERVLRVRRHRGGPQLPGGNECHGWIGVKFQSHVRDEPSQIVLHVRMLDAEASLQQEALGIVGVNLLYGAFFHHHEPEVAIESLLDRLSTGRIEIDMIQFKGIEFRSVDNRLMALKLVQLGLSGVAMFGPDGEVLQPSEALRKRSIIVERGSFRPPTLVNIDMLESALAKFDQDPAVAGTDPLPLTELTMANLMSTATSGTVNRRDFLARADLLAACGMTTLISDYVEYHRLAQYLFDRTTSRIGIVMGVPSLIEVFRESHYAHMAGGILESFGRMFKNQLKLFVYPMLRDGEVVSVDTVQVEPELQPLYDYLNRRGSFVDLDNYKPDYLPILSRDVLRRIAAGDEVWETQVPDEVAELIKKRAFFDYRRPET